MPGMHTDPTPLLTTRQVLDRLGYSDPSAIARLVANGKLTPAHKAPGKRGAYAFHAAEIDRYLTERAA
jgi:predicted DNA-binding transcriptional regulator AlpA